ncbi:MAG: hypothetical protein IKU17_01210 [Clostridia bacterium]|nr:hypothetical protein [Clostridia bacterium]
MTRREKNRLQQEEAARIRQQAEKDTRTRKIVLPLVFAGAAAAGFGAGFLLLFFTAYGALSAGNVLQMALPAALTAMVVFPLLYGACYGVFHRVAATRPQKKKLARLATAAALCTALLTLVLCILFDLI